jgi:hypothetical protein
MTFSSIHQIEPTCLSSVSLSCRDSLDVVLITEERTPTLLFLWADTALAANMDCVADFLLPEGGRVCLFQPKESGDSI